MEFHFSIYPPENGRRKIQGHVWAYYTGDAIGGGNPFSENPSVCIRTINNNGVLNEGVMTS